jgi:hypothetical protein
VLFVGLKRGCVIGKHARESFKKTKFQANKLLELIHTDIYGPITLAFFEG